MMERQINRANELWHNWELREMELVDIPEIADEHGRDVTRQKYEYLKQGYYRLMDSPTDHEKPKRDMIGVICDKLQRQLYPSPVLRFFRRLKSEFLDKPKYLAAHRRLVLDNVEGLSSVLKFRGLAGLSQQLSRYLDFERDAVEIPVAAQLDGERKISLIQHLEKDNKGRYQFADLEVSLSGSVDPNDNLEVSLDKKYQLSNLQLVNLIQGRAVLLVQNKCSLTANDQWLQLAPGKGFGETQLKVFAADYGYNLKSELEKLASDTGLFRMTAAEALKELQLGGRFSLSGHHPKDKPFTLEADPGNKGLVIRDHDGQQISSSALRDSLRHVLPHVAKGTRLDKERGRHRKNASEKGLEI